MADYQTIVRLRPEVREFIRNREWVRRGDVVAYGPNIRCNSFSTDEAGFRHSTFRDDRLSLAQCVGRERYGLILGSSNLYGFGLAGNANTLPSLLARRFGFPFAGMALPEANSRNLHSLLTDLLGRTRSRPAVVIHMSGGDFTAFCYTSVADPVFGSPNLKQMGAAGFRSESAAPETEMPALLAFTSFWTRAIVSLCRAAEIPVVLGNDTTFFEKRRPSDVERSARLGEPTSATQHRQFETHVRLVTRFYERRHHLADSLSVPIAGPGPSNDIGFIDEFHYDAEGTRALAEDFATAVDRLL